VPDQKFQISLAAWSMHRMFYAKEIDQLGMVDLTHELGIGGIELVNTFFPSPQYQYLKKLRQRADDAGVAPRARSNSSASDICNSSAAIS